MSKGPVWDVAAGTWQRSRVRGERCSAVDGRGSRHPAEPRLLHFALEARSSVQVVYLLYELKSYFSKGGGCLA